MAKKILEDTPVVACVQGEYEEGICQVFRGPEESFRIICSPKMNEAPFPWFDEEHAYLYWDEKPLGQHPPQAQV